MSSSYYHVSSYVGQSEHEDEDQSEFPDFDSMKAETGEPDIDPIPSQAPIEAAGAAEPAIKQGLSRREKRRLNIAKAGEGHQTSLPAINPGDQAADPNAAEVVKKRKKNRRVTRKDRKARLERLELEGKSGGVASGPVDQGVGVTSTIGDMAESDDGRESRSDGETSGPDSFKEREALMTSIAGVKKELQDTAIIHEKSRSEWLAEKAAYEERLATKDHAHEDTIAELKGQIQQQQSSGATAANLLNAKNAALMAQVKTLRQDIDSRDLELRHDADTTYIRVMRPEYNDLLDTNRQLTEKVNSFESIERTYREKLQKKEEEIQRGVRSQQLTSVARDAALNGRNAEAAKVLEKKKEVDKCKKEIEDLQKAVAGLESQLATSNSALETLRNDATTANDLIKSLQEQTTMIAEIVAERDRFFRQVEDVHKLLSEHEAEIEELNLLLTESNGRIKEMSKKKEDKAVEESKNLSEELQALVDDEAQEPEAHELASVLTSPTIHVVADIEPSIECQELEEDEVARALTISTIVHTVNIPPLIDSSQVFVVVPPRELPGIAPIAQLEEDGSAPPPTLPDDAQDSEITETPEDGSAHGDSRLSADGDRFLRRSRRNAAFDSDTFIGPNVFREDEIRREPREAPAGVGVQTEPQPVFAMAIYRSIDPVRGWLTVYTDLYLLLCLWMTGHWPSGPLVLDGTVFGDRDGHIIDIKSTPIAPNAADRAQEVKLTQTRRPPPPLFENLVALCLHLIVYGFLLYTVHQATVLYPVLRNERAIWLGANDLTRQLVVNWRNSMSCAPSGGGFDGGGGVWADLFFDINQGLQVNRILPG